ncbi:hypothetical protein WICMUC_001614 [Wickerhamomyces mucosus]|uniref:TATA-binding protein-associated factor mot1 n=1 Tax=Wickerhamomyces mucosus TaxID=1378264 RepID=A0A9P8TGZ4_9ASCO|nr:hypothetical protein WICMUC_001614 [Wickerhamomyces mucosus]
MSRLERLVILLDTGSTNFIRNTAADQLSDLAKSHPEEVLNLISRVYPYLQSNKWETRTAAARAIGGIASHVELFDPNQEDTDFDNINVKIEELSDDQIKLENEEKKKLELMKKLEHDDERQFITLEDWNLTELFKSGKKLLSTSEIDKAKPNSMDALKKQKVSIDKSLGFNNKSSFESSVIKEEKKSLEQGIKVENGDQSESSTPIASGISSARLKAMAKRKAKMEAKNGPSKSKPIDLSQSSVSRKLVKEDIKDLNIKQEQINHIDITEQTHANQIVVESKSSEIPSVLSEHAKVAGLIWPFQGIYELLLVNLFSENWEIRHGAVLGLREIIKKHGKGAGRIKGKDRQENDSKNNQTLEDLTCRFLTLFALDRFGDFVYDTVVAPVRESAAQALAALLLHLNSETILKVFGKLNQLVLQEGMTPCWQASHGGMLGLRYLVSIRTDIFVSHPELLDDVLKMVLHGLRESDDDVQAVAAATLTPITDEFVRLKNETISVVLNTIWDCLTKLKDDLSASIGSVMDLLSKLCINPEVLKVINKQAENNSEYAIKNLVPKLYPFLRHSIKNVRKSVLNTLLAFLSISDENAQNWIDGESFRFVFQNLLLEQDSQILQLSQQVFEKLLHETDKNESIALDEVLLVHFQPLLTLLMTPIGITRYNYTMPQNLIMRPSGVSINFQFASPPAEATDSNEDDSGTTSAKRGKKRKSPSTPDSAIPAPENERINIDGPMLIGDITLLGEEVFYRTRLAAARAFGQILSYIKDESLEIIIKLLQKYFNVPHSTPRLLTSVIITEYCTSLLSKDIKPSPLAIENFYPYLMEILTNPDKLPAFRELVPTLKTVRTQCHSLFRVFVDEGKISQSKIPDLPIVVQGENDAGPGAFSLELADQIVGETYAKLESSLQPIYKMSAQSALEQSKQAVQQAINDAKNAKNQRTVAILSNFASSVVLLDDLPKKLNPLIRSLMDSVKSESLEDLQQRSAHSVSNLIQKLISNNKPNVADKIVKNLCQFLCVDTLEVPEFEANLIYKNSILSLRKEESNTEISVLEDARIKRRGAKLSLETILRKFDSAVFDRIPQLEKVIFDPLFNLAHKPILEIENNEVGQSIVDSFGILKALIPTINDELNNKVLSVLPHVSNALKSDYSVFRYSAAKVLAVLAKKLPSETIPFIIKHVLPSLNNAGDVKDRQGSIEAVYHISSTMDSDILPYVIFLIVPVLGRMSDADQDVRVLATTTFASIIKLVPLEAGIPDPVDISQELLEGREKEREFIQQMMNPSKSKPFSLPVAIKATLRKYQQDGINWLAFLNKYHLHGILCDDMGLGKTLQTICIIASDHHLRAEDYKLSKSIETRPLPSLIVCPPSLTGHWEQEFNQYSPFLKVLVYAGGPTVRSALRTKFTNDVDIIVTSYDVIRNDIEFLSDKDYNYCVLDEGHIIKNASSKLTKSVKRVRANHRLILSGTPIQNNVLELWSLFDFLMPGFLGSEKTFQERFAKPIAASRNSKTSSKEQEAGALALEALHKQVLPFMLRRLKEEVLSDLPPKIIQDYYCELGDLQKQLYNDFAKKQKDVVQKDLNTSEMSETKTHIFQALQYMRKLCNHPALVLNENHPQYRDVEKYLRQTGLGLHDIRHAPKLLALKNLLLECGIGVADIEKSKNETSGVISQHRALIFCQLKDMLDMVEDDLLRKHLPSVSFMRLDGTTDPRHRQSIVRKFNEDPSIDVLLLTTKVGGLGLNLTGADTVIFVEHDWNPMNDLQAMDRAHRLGQKKVVNVYRLITKDTLEEKIMGLQKFKINIASTIVSQQNAGLASMDTNQLLDLFDAEQQGQQESNNEELRDDESNHVKTQEVINESGLSGKAGAIIGDLGELWDQSQYEEEYNLDTFIKSLK